MTTVTKKPENKIPEGENETSFVRDLAMAQAEMENAAYNKVNPHFKSKYADYASVRHATMPLHQHGFSVNSRMRIEYSPAGEIVRILKMTLRHHSVGVVDESEWVIVGDTEQQRGSSMTYGKRYLLSGLAGIASEEDDDANEAMNAGVKQKSAYQARSDKDYEALLHEMNACLSRNELFEWRKSIMSRRAALPDSWRELLDEQSELRRLNLIDLEKEVSET